MPGINTYNNYGRSTDNVYQGYPNRNTGWNGAGGYYDPSPAMQQMDYREFVHGRAGAEAYQLKTGVNLQVLWDDETDRFYIKGYDNTGRPRILADNDFQPHVEPEPKSMEIDLTPYATKEDIKQMIEETLSNAQRPNLSGYVTMAELNKVLNSLSVGNGGRIVRDNESNG